MHANALRTGGPKRAIAGVRVALAALLVGAITWATGGGWLPTLLTGARNSKIQPGNDGYLDCSSLVKLKEIPRQKVDRSMGDVHPGGNPHYLIDPDNAVRVARGIAARLGKLDPDGKAAYSKNAAAFVKRLAAARATRTALSGSIR